MVQRNGARGMVDAKVHTPSCSSEECYVTDLDSGTRPTWPRRVSGARKGAANICAFRLFPDKNAVRFIPRENGVHSIDVKFNGCHIPGSPFKVRVGDPGLIGDPGMVTAHGPGLQGGCTGTTAPGHNDSVC